MTASKKAEKNEIAVQIGEIVPVNGIPMRVKNFTPKSVVVHPEVPLVFFFKGQPMKLHKLEGGNLVLRMMTEKEIERAREAVK